MATIRQMTLKGDPMLRTQIANDLILMLQASAKQNRRRVQDEFIKRLAATFNDGVTLDVDQEMGNSQNNMQPYAQVISSDMLQALQSAAEAKNIPLHLEINLRLTTSLATPEPLLNSILNCKFSYEEAVAECKNSRQRWLYLYEMEKLKLYLKFSDKLPKETKEKFILIDVDAATEELKAELAKEDMQEK